MDFIGDVFGRIRTALEPYLDDETMMELDQLEDRVRYDWGGTSAYITKRPDRERIREQVLNELRRGVPIPKVASTTGVSRSEIYRILKRKKEK